MDMQIVQTWEDWCTLEVHSARVRGAVRCDGGARAGREDHATLDSHCLRPAGRCVNVRVVENEVGCERLGVHRFGQSERCGERDGRHLKTNYRMAKSHVV